MLRQGVVTESLGLLSSLLDIRPNQEFQRATFHGAVVSFFLALAVCLLIWRELRFSMETETVSSLFVNSTIASRVNVT